MCLPTAHRTDKMHWIHIQIKTYTRTPLPNFVTQCTPWKSFQHLYGTHVVNGTPWLIHIHSYIHIHNTRAKHARLQYTCKNVRTDWIGLAFRALFKRTMSTASVKVCIFTCVWNVHCPPWPVNIRFTKNGAFAQAKALFHIKMRSSKMALFLTLFVFSLLMGKMHMYSNLSFTSAYEGSWQSVC